MKKILILITFLISCNYLFGQDDVYFSQKKNIVSRIVIKTGKSKADNLNFCIEILTNNEIVCSQNKETFTVKTDLQNTKKRGYPYYLNFFCKDSVIVVSGKFKSGISIELYGVRSEDNFEAIQNKGMKGSIYRITFDEMKSIAEKFTCPIILN